MSELIERFRRWIDSTERHVWVVLELDEGTPWFITWTPTRAEAIRHYQSCCDALDLPYDDPHNVEVDVFIFHGKCGEDLAQVNYSEAEDEI